MISDGNKSVLVSSIGWVDRDSLWIFDPGKDRESRISLGGGARYLSLHSSGTGRFAVVHHFDGARFEATVHSFEEPAIALARAVVDEKHSEMSGEPRIWKDVPRLYAEYLGFPPWKDYVLLDLSAARMQIDIRKLAWFDESYDKSYQGIVTASELPGGKCALVSVQRSSEVVIHDLETGMKKGGIHLAGRGGNPTFRFRRTAAEIWATDYDTIVVVDPGSLRTMRSARLQKSCTGTMQFLGDLDFDPDEELCAVARPFCGDVVGIDPSNLGKRSIARLGRQPLEVAALPENRIVARDWKTGETLRGVLKKRLFGLFA